MKTMRQSIIDGNYSEFREEYLSMMGYEPVEMTY